MDSITQAVLGAAVGQAFLGKQLGNRALLWGGFAGTIPDLDVFSRLFLSHEVYGLIYHRGITHSIFFTLLFSPFFAWLAYRYYQKNWHHRLGLQVGYNVVLGFIYSAFIFLFGFLAYRTLHWIPIVLFLIFAGCGYFVFRRLVLNVRHRQDFNRIASWRSWTLMFFFAIWTHWFIDACTSYGTQIFEPFSNYRIAFDNISIVDPLYTTPLLLGCFAAYFLRAYKWKNIANLMGIVLSTAYMAYTFYVKTKVNTVVADSLKAQNIEYTDFVTSPTIGNTILWQTTVQTPDSFYYGMYSLFDKEANIQFLALPRNHELLEPHKNEELVQILLWFANDYYNVIRRDDGNLQFNNLRFGLLGGGTYPLKDPYIFKFVLGQHNGKFDAWQERDIEQLNMGDMLSAFWTRLKGI